MRYKFDIVLKNNKNTVECQKGMGHGESCHVEVLDVPWKHLREINWNQTNCSRKSQPPEQGEQEHTDYFIDHSHIYFINDEFTISQGMTTI